MTNFNCRLHYLCFASLLAACNPGDTSVTAGASTTATTSDATTVASTTDTTTTPTSTTDTTVSTTAATEMAVTDSSATQDTGDCEPGPCDGVCPPPCDGDGGCEAGCTPKLVCDGTPRATCVCECEDPSTSDTGDTTDTTGSTGAPETSTGTSETGESTGTTGEPAIACGGDDPYFPEFDRACDEPADCALVFHQLDCCGSLAALGISAAVAGDFAEAEAECAMQYPDCKCAVQPTIADDGSSTLDNSAFEVTCARSQCISFVP